MNGLGISIFSIVLLVATEVAAAPIVSGIHSHNPDNISAAAEAGYRAIRLWDTRTTWSDLMPERYLWKFDRINTELAASEKEHLKVIWTIGSTPRWASARPDEKCSYGYGCAAEPYDIEDWRRYVQTIATTFRGRIECYEPWNEVSFPHDPSFAHPGAGGDPNQFFTGSITAMASLVKVAYEEIKRADPDACVLSPSFHSSGNAPEKLDRFLSIVGGRYFDAISLHYYLSGEPEDSVRFMSRMRHVLAKHGLSDLPVWNTEVGVNFERMAAQRSGMTREDAVYSIMLRTYLVNVSEGIRRVYWYAWDNGKLGFFERPSGKDFGTRAVAEVLRLIDGTESVYCHHKEALWQCHVEAGSRHFTVVWVSGRTATPESVDLEYAATRWGSTPERFSAGQRILVDGRPVIVEEPQWAEPGSPKKSQGLSNVTK